VRGNDAMTTQKRSSLALSLAGMILGASATLVPMVALAQTAPPTITLTANGVSALTITTGDSYTLEWNSTNASSCTILYTGSASGSFSLIPNTKGAGITGLAGSITITCIGTDGTSVSKTVTITAVAPPNYPRGYIESSTYATITGWAQDKDIPDSPIDVHIYIDKPPTATDFSGYVGMVSAKDYRSDLCTSISSCNHAYSFTPPTKYQDGILHTVYAYGIDEDGVGAHNLALIPYASTSNTFQYSAPVTPIPTISEPNVGTNSFGLALQYLGRAALGGDGSEKYLTVTAAMAKKAIIDARTTGATFMRVAITGYSAADMALWRSDPEDYWTLMDKMFSDLRGSNMKIVPVFTWNWVQFPAIAGGTVKDMYTDPQSASYLLLTKYVREFVTRYKDDKSVLFYELTNELNLVVDLDQKTRCIAAWGASNCTTTANVSTTDMIAFTSSLAAYIRTLDSTRLISSGFSMPRPAAEHLRIQPEWSAAGPDWTLDSQTQFAKNITDIHKGIDIVSVHLYDPDNKRFGTTAATLSVIKKTADGIRKNLYIGEFGDLQSAVLSKDILKSIVTLGIPYASPWAWEFYQFYTYTPNAWNIEPGYTDDLIDAIRQTNVQLGNTPTTSSVPQVLITWPLDGSSIADSQLVYAVASDGNGKKVARVDFLLDDTVKSSVATPPYQYTLPKTLVQQGRHVIIARVYDATGTSADSSIVIQDGVVDNSLPPLPTTPEIPTPTPIPTPITTTKPSNDFNGDLKSDILWEKDTSTGTETYIWLMNGTTQLSNASAGQADSVWYIAGNGDFNGGGKSDILWENSSTGGTYIWFMDGTKQTSSAPAGTGGAGWHIAGTGDFNGDGKSDILWQKDTSTGTETYIWLMDGTKQISSASAGSGGSGWHIISAPTGT